MQCSCVWLAICKQLATHEELMVYCYFLQVGVAELHVPLLHVAKLSPTKA